MFSRVFLIKLDVCRLDDQLAALGHGIPGVNRQVHDDLLDLAGIGLHPSQVFCEPAYQGNVLTDKPPQHRLQVPDQNVKVQNLRLQRLLAAEGQQLARKCRGAVGAEDHLVQILGQGIVLRQLRLHHLTVALDGHEDVVEVVGHPARQLPDGLQLLRLAELFLQLSVLGHVHEEAHIALPAIDNRWSGGHVRNNHGTVFAQARDPGRKRLLTAGLGLELSEHSPQRFLGMNVLDFELSQFLLTVAEHPAYGRITETEALNLEVGNQDPLTGPLEDHRAVGFWPLAGPRSFTQSDVASP